MLIIFYLAGITAIISSLSIVFSSNPIRAVFKLIVANISTAIILLLINQELVASIYIFITSSLALTIFLFSFIVSDVRKSNRVFYLKIRHWVSLLLASAFSGILVINLINYQPISKYTGKYTQQFLNKFGALETLGAVLFEKYQLPLLLIPIIFLVASITGMSCIENEHIEKNNHRNLN